MEVPRFVEAWLDTRIEVFVVLMGLMELVPIAFANYSNKGIGFNSPKIHDILPSSIMYPI